MTHGDRVMASRMVHPTQSGAPAAGRGPAWRPLGWLAIAAAGLAAGCGTREIQSANPVDPAAERLLALGVAYSRFNFDHGKPPRGPEDLRGLLGGADAFTSPRDAEPFVVFWGVDLRSPPTWATGRPILAHERTGVAGSRYVLTTMRNVERLEDDEFRRSSFPPPKPAKP